jgi:hypothetical protein
MCIRDSPDRVHESAAKDALQLVRDGLPAGVPMLIGTRSKG